MLYYLYILPSIVGASLSEPHINGTAMHKLYYTVQPSKRAKLFKTTQTTLLDIKMASTIIFIKLQISHM